MGMPRRYWQYPPEFQVLNVLSTAGSTHSGCRICSADGLFPVVHALRKNRRSDNPWGAAGLEWKTSSPPPTFNFDETPEVTWEAYDYEEIPAPRRCRLAIAPSPSSTHGPELQHHFADMRAAARRRLARHVAVPGHRDHVFWRHVLRLSGLSLLVLPRIRRRQPQHRHLSGHDQYRCSHLQQLDRSAWRACRADGQAQATGHFVADHAVFRSGFSRHQRHRVVPQIQGAPRSRHLLQCRGHRAEATLSSTSTSATSRFSSRFTSR